MKIKYTAYCVVASINVFIIYWLLSSNDPLTSIKAILPYLAFSIVPIVFFAFFLIIRRWREQSLELIQIELDEGKEMYFTARVGGVIDGMKYTGPILTFAVFDDCFIFSEHFVEII